MVDIIDTLPRLPFNQVVVIQQGNASLASPNPLFGGDRAGFVFFLFSV
jgi:hypothetical protein